MLFQLKTWLNRQRQFRRWGLTSPGANRRASHRRACRLPPFVEWLEERTLPAALLAVTPISWNVIGLDSNNVNAGPNRFLVGARVTNTGDTTATNVQVDYAWDSNNTLINLESRPGQSIPTLAAGASADFYYNVVVTRDAAAYNTARRYHISASADGVAAVSTPSPRELYIEKILSQNRNSDLSISGPATVQVGGTYTYHLTSSSSPGGYDELESFLTFSVNYRIVSIATTYTTPVGGTNDKIYADSGGWQNDPTSANYLSAVGPVNPLYPGGVGGIINTDFTVTILSAGNVSVTGLILDHSGGSFHYNADVGTLSQNITAVDDPPVANDDSAVTDENSAVAVNVAANDTDPNNNLDPPTVQVSSGPAHGTAVVNPASGIVTYTPNANFRGVDSFTYTIRDAGGNESNPATVSITVNPVNQAPVNTVPGTQLTPQNVARVFSTGNGNAISVADVDAFANAVEVTLTATNGTIALNGLAGLTLLAGNGTADASVTVLGTIASINAALDGLSFQPTPNFNGAATLTIATDDLGNTGAGGPLSASSSVTINVTQVNQPPVNTVPGTQTILAGQSLVFSPSNGNALSVFDVDAGGNAIVTTLSVPAGTGMLTATAAAGVTITGNNGNVVTLTGAQSAINSALNGLTYAPSAAASGANVTLTITTNDQGNSGTGGPQSATNTVTLRVAPINQPPVNTVPGAQTLNENTSLVFAGAAQIAVADPDAGSATVQVTLSVGKGTLTLSGTSGLTFISGSGTANSSMTFLGTLTALNNALNNLRYTPGVNVFGADTLTITTNDLGNTGSGGPKSATSTVAMTIVQINQAPVVTVPTGAGYVQFTAFNQSVVFSRATGNPMSVADVDAGNANVTVTLTITPPSPTTKYVLTLASTAGLIVSGNGTMGTVVTLTGPLSAINVALDGLNFNPGNDKTGVFVLTVNANDNGNSGAGGPLTDTKTVSIDAEKTVGGGAYQDQAPVNAINDVSISPTPPSYTTTVNTPLTFSTATNRRLTSNDPDAGTATTYKVTLSVTHGVLTVPPLPPTDTTTIITGNGTAAVTLTGIAFNINNALNGLVFTPATGFSGTATLTIVSNDQGNQGALPNGVSGLTDTDSISISISGNASPVNTVPASQVLPENTPFAPSTLVFSTGNNNALSVADPAATASSDQVTLSVADGILTLGSTTGLTVSGNNTGTVTFAGTLANINAALAGLTYTPTLHYNGADSLQFTTTDTDGLSASSSVALTVTPVNDPPTLAAPGAQSL